MRLRASRVAAVVLAGGRSERMGPVNKLLTVLGDTPMVARVADQVLSSRARPLVVVTGHDGAAVREALGMRPVLIAINPDFAAGMSTSLRAGVAALPDDIEAVLICLGDMPLVGPAVLDRLIDAFDPVRGQTICVPVADGRPGNPVLFGRKHFAALACLTGDTGARAIVRGQPEAVVEVTFDDSSVLMDVDQPEDIKSITKHLFP